MTATPFRAFATVSLVVALLFYVGCSSGKRDSSQAEGSTSGGSKEDAKTPEVPKKADPATSSKAPTKALFEGWPRPLAAIMISGEQLGYLEPCGCTEGQAGGLLRRYELAERIRNTQKWPLVLVDLGSLIKDPGSARGGPEQAKIKLNTALKALTVMGYDALALSPEDLKVGVDEAVGQILNLPGDKTRIVVANVVAAGLESKIVPSVRAKSGSITVGITAVVDPEKLKGLKDPSLDLLTIKPIDEALPSVLADLEKDTKTQVLLVQAAPAEAKRLALKYPGFDVVVATSTLPDPAGDAERLNGGKTLLVNVGQRGKYAGVVGIFDDPAEPYRYARVSLDKRFDGPAKPMKAVIEGEFRDQLKALKTVENFPRHAFVNGTRDASFLGAETCKTCHPNTFARWATTKHALAFQSLEHDPKPNVIYDAECITCHTTGFEYNSGWKSPEATPFLKGNQCENCHGPGSRHASEPDNLEFRKPMKLTAEHADKSRLCLRCHDEDNSPHFDFAKYWGQVVHNGLDTYNSPDVYKGRPVKPKSASGK